MFNKKKFVIVSPRQRYGGPIVLYSLCQYLCELGYDSKILYFNSLCGLYKRNRRIKFFLKYIYYRLLNFYKVLNVHIFGAEKYRSNAEYCGYIDETVKNCNYRFFPWVDNNIIVVYPEIIYGNFTLASNVVRLFLYHNQYDDDAYGKNDMFWCYREIFNDYHLNPSGRKICAPYFNLDLYKQTNFGNRKGNCYVIRKGCKRNDLPKFFDGIVIDNLPEVEKVRVMNECEYCISYDTQTAYSTIAAICGCISVVVPEPGRTKADYIKTDDTETYGVAYGFNDAEIEYAKSTRNKARERCENMNKQGKENVKFFAEECIKYFSNKA